MYKYENLEDMLLNGALSLTFCIEKGLFIVSFKILTFLLFSNPLKNNFSI